MSFDNFFLEQTELCTRIKNSFANAASVKEPTKGSLVSRMEALEKNWTRFVQQHLELIKFRDQNKTNEYFTSDFFSKTEEAYVTAKGNFLDAIENLPSAQAGASNISVAPMFSSSRSMPKIELPKFSGVYTEWSNFADLFKSMVHSNAALTSVEKLHHLKTNLSGEAAQLVRHISVTNENYTRCWELLEDRYENKRVLVHSHLSGLFSLQPMKVESASSLRELYNSTIDYVEALDSLNEPVSEWSSILVYLTVERLDHQSLRDWETSIGSSKEPPTFEELKTFLKNRLRALEAVESTTGCCKQASSQSSTKSQHQKRKFGRQQKSSQSTTANVNAVTEQQPRKSLQDRKCFMCREQHFLMSCPQFRSQTVAQRKEFVTQRRLCSNCLGSHMIENCASKNVCQLCQGKHHTILHESLSVQTQHFPGSSTVPTPQANSHAVSVMQVSLNETTSVLLTTAMVFVTAPSGQTLYVRAFLDQGSEVSIISESLAQRLQLPRTKGSVRLLGVGESKSGTSRGSVSVEVKPHFPSDFRLKLKALVLPKLVARRQQTKFQIDNWPHLADLQLADPKFFGNHPIDMILGVDVYSILIEPGLRKSNLSAPVAQKTVLGWILCGPTGEESSIYNSPVSTFHCCKVNELYFDLQKFWEDNEVVPPKPLRTPEEEACEQHFLETHSRTKEGRYVVRLPTKNDVAKLGDSYSSALRLLLHSEQRFTRDSRLQDAYTDFMEEYKRLQHMVSIKESSDPRNDSRSFFLPHHGVWRDSSLTTKLRVVFNGSRSSSRGVSLNDCLHAGPKLQLNISDVLLQWRRHPIVLSADVEKMYRQILVHADDQDLQRILWRTTPSEPVQIFRLTTVTYGLTCAPYLAVRTVQQLGLDEGHRFPLAAEVIKNSVYVDDVLSGADSLEDAAKLYDQLLELFKAGGFPLRKWTTNCPELLEQIPVDLQALSSNLSWHSETSVSMLGLIWQPESDCFIFKIELTPINDVITKRLVASRSAQLFDPLGWLSPVIVVTKIILQGLWKLKISWDDSLPDELSQRWKRYYEDLQYLSSVRIHRWIGLRSSGCSYELHGFGDASERAYAAVVYVKSVLTTVDCSVVLIASKTKVAPVKAVALPRLELCAAVLLARLVAYIQSILKLDAPLHMWSDSTTALAWIADSPSKRKTYIANRVSEIQTTLPSAVWHHVPGKDNPADCASRGVSAREFSSFSLWWNGPEWLPNQNDWPSGPLEPPDRSVDMEERVTVNLVTREKQHWYLFRLYSSLDKLLRVTALCFRFYNALRLRSMVSSPHITASELHQARLRLIQHEQLRVFSEEISALKRKDKISKRSHLMKFNPFLDGELLRVGGRLKHSLLSFDEKHPLLLPSDSILTKLLIEDCHRRCLHGGTQLTLGTLRQSYWILRGRSLVRSVIHHCVPCVKNRAAIPQQLMADLPSIRSTPSSRPFLNTGVDYAGPIKLRTHKGRGFKSFKAYICIFVCCSTRAVHLEVVSDYMASGFIAAYQRFSSRRGVCKTLVSDNAKNFVGADRQLKQMFAGASEESQAIASFLASDGTEWKFNPPAGSHFGGLYEAAVKSTKFHLKRTIGETLLTFEEMTTFLTQIEACLNSRPLIAESDDPKDFSALTPGHFLIGCPLNAIPEPSLTEVAQNHLSRWQLIQQMRQHFWKRWSSEYLKELQPRSKWRTLQPSIQLGDLVLIRDENLPPTKWAMGRVIKLHRGSDGLIRVVTLKTQRDSITRPIVKLCLLPRATSDINEIVKK